MRVLLGIGCLVLSLSTCLVLPQSIQRPTLYVVESESCLPCREFCDRWTNTPGFADRLRSGFHVRGLHWENPEQRALAERLGVKRLPSFVVVDAAGQTFAPIVGFISENDLLSRLGLAPLTRSVSQSVPRSTPQADPAKTGVPPAAVGPAIDEIARREISRLESSMRELSRRSQESAGRGGAATAEAEKEIAALKVAIAELQARGGSPSGNPLPSSANISPEMSSGVWSGLLSFGMKAAATMLLPEAVIPAGVLSVGASLIGVWLGRRGRRGGPEAFRGQSRVVPIAVDSAPPPPVVHRETRFVDVERDSFAQAHAWAVEQLVRKYPNSQSWAEAQASLINQFLNAKGQPCQS